jgi:hypothetical protein
MDHAIVSHDEWLAARRALLEREKEFTRQGDELRRQVRALPWEVVTKEYAFDGPDGTESLSDLFAERSPSSSITSCSTPTTVPVVPTAHCARMASPGSLRT